MRGDLRSTFSWKLRSNSPPATRHSGMLTKKIHGQLRNWVNTPPRVGPTTAAIAHTLAR